MLITNKCIIINCIPNKYKGSRVALYLLLGNISQLVGPNFIKLIYRSFDKNILLLIIHLMVYILSNIFSLYSSFYRLRNVENVNEINNGKEKELEDIEKL